MEIYKLLKERLNVDFDTQFKFSENKFKLTNAGLLYWDDGVWTELSVEDILVSRMIVCPESIITLGIEPIENNFYFYISGTGKVQRKRYRKCDIYAEQLRKNNNLFEDKESALKVCDKISKLLEEAHYET